MLNMKDEYIAQARMDQLRREAEKHNQQVRALAAGKNKAAGKRQSGWWRGWWQWASKFFSRAAAPAAHTGAEVHEQPAV